MQGLDRDRRPLAVLRVCWDHDPRHRPAVCAHLRPAPSSATASPRRSSPTTARCSPTASVCNAHRGALRQDLPRERNHPPAHRPGLAHHHGQNRALPPDPFATEFLCGQIFSSLEVGPEGARHLGRDYYNTERPHQSLNMATPSERFWIPGPSRSRAASRPPGLTRTAPGRTGWPGLSRSTAPSRSPTRSSAWQAPRWPRHRRPRPRRTARGMGRPRTRQDRASELQAGR